MRPLYPTGGNLCSSFEVRLQLLYTSGLLMKFVARRESVSAVVQRFWHIIVGNPTFQNSSQHNFNCGGDIIHVQIFNLWSLILPERWETEWNAGVLSQFLEKLLCKMLNCVVKLSILPFDWQVPSLSWLPRLLFVMVDVQGAVRDECRRLRGMATEKLSFHSGFSLRDMLPHPPYCPSVSAADWQRNSSASDTRQEFVWVFALPVLNMGERHGHDLGRSAYSHSYDRASQH